jgi:hypothetical protein
MQKQERIKKLLIILVALSLFGASYYYYVHKTEKAPEVKKVSPKIKKKAVTENKKDEEKQEATVSKEEKTEPVNKQKENKEKQISKPQKEDKKKIKPTDKSDLLKTALATAGKNDPFSYTESRFRPSVSKNSRSLRTSGNSGLPGPPSRREKSGDGIEIKGFLGNKVIAEVNGHTDSLNTGETFRGVKVLTVDPNSLSCVFEINGRKVTKKIKPVSRPNKDVEIKYVNN